jgi:3-hydroxyisobutyrate dehydrogenase-like beta-hydroxyacid dehydrogenase
MCDRLSILLFYLMFLRREEYKRKMIAQEEYEPAGFKLSLGLKDVTLVLQTASDSRMPMPFASLLHERLMASVAQGRGDIDWTGLALEISQQAGIK